MAHLIYEQNDFELNKEQSDVIQSGFFKCDEDQKIVIESSFEINLVKLFLEIIDVKENKEKFLEIPKHDIYMLFLLSKSWGIKEYQIKFGKFLFGEDYQTNININCNDSVEKITIKSSLKSNISSYKIKSLKYQAEIEFSSIYDEKCLVDILDDENPWFYQPNPNDQNPFITIFFKDQHHVVDTYTLKMSKLPISLQNSKKWQVEALIKGKKKSSPTVWKTIDTVFIVKAPKPNDSITRRSLIQNRFLAIKIISKDKKLSLHSISFGCTPPLKCNE